jgi:rubredoxin
MKCENCGAETQGKFCEYCGSEMPQEKSTVNITNNYYGGAAPQEQTDVDNKFGRCPKCGNSKITFKRERVGTATQSRSRKNYVGRGRQGRSVSQAVYRTVGVCQNCGYTWNPNATNKDSGKKTWLWVLGWICIFPLPLTILLLRKKDMKPALKYGIIAVAWLLFLVMGSSGYIGADVPQTDAPSSYNETVQGDQTTDNSSLDNQSNEVAATYAEDTVVNRFITEFNENSAYEITDISEGNIRTKYFGYANGRRLEMINANEAAAEAFCLKINGGQEASDKQTMYEVFREAVKILDPSVTDEMIDATLAEFDNKDVLIEGYALGNSIIVTYVPTKELSYGKNSCRIDILASNYK